MAWQTEMVLILRYFINDLGSPPVYTDERLQTLLAIAGQYVQFDLGFPQYTIDISVPSITPDPCDAKDKAFINLVVLKAACLLDGWGLREKLATSGISVKSGPDTVSTGGQLSGYQWLLKNGACKGYDDAKWEYQAGNLSPGAAILGPFAGWNVDTDDYNFYTNGGYGGRN